MDNKAAALSCDKLVAIMNQNDRDQFVKSVENAVTKTWENARGVIIAEIDRKLNGKEALFDLVSGQELVDKRLKWCSGCKTHACSHNAHIQFTEWLDQEMPICGFNIHQTGYLVTNMGRIVERAHNITVPPPHKPFPLNREMVRIMQAVVYGTSQTQLIEFVSIIHTLLGIFTAHHPNISEVHQLMLLKKEADAAVKTLEVKEAKWAKEQEEMKIKRAEHEDRIKRFLEMERKMRARLESSGANLLNAARLLTDAGDLHTASVETSKEIVTVVITDLHNIRQVLAADPAKK